MEQQQLIDKMVTEVMEDFDFQTVHDTMLRLDWKWNTGETRFLVPSIYYLMKQAEKFLRKVAQYIGEKDNYTISSGGFVASLEGEQLSLRFILTESSSFVSDFNSLAAAQMGRKAYGFEIKKNFYKDAKEIVLRQMQKNLFI